MYKLENKSDTLMKMTVHMTHVQFIKVAMGDFMVISNLTVICLYFITP